MQAPSQKMQAPSQKLQAPLQKLQAPLQGLLCLIACMLVCTDAHAFGLLERIGNGQVAAQKSSLATFIRGRYARTVIADTFNAFVWQRCLYGVCVPTYAAVTKVRIREGGAWKELKIGSNAVMWSAGNDANKDYALSLFPWLKDKRRDYCMFEFSTTTLGGPVVVETTYEEVIPMFGNKWAYRVPFGWNVGGGGTPVNTWTIDVETDEDFSQPKATPLLPGIRIEGRRMFGTVTGGVSSGEPIIECVEHPDHRNTTVRDSYGSNAHIGVFVTPVLESVPAKPRTVSIIMPPGLTHGSAGLPQARLFFDALLSRLGPQDRVNIWSNSNPTQRLWTKTQRAHDDNVFAILTLLDNQINNPGYDVVNQVLDSVRVYDRNDSTQHIIVIITSGTPRVDMAALNRVSQSTPISIVTMSNGLPASGLNAICKARGGTYQHVAWWYGWRSLIPSIADSCLGVTVNSVSSTIIKTLSPEPPADTKFIQGSRKVVYAYDDGREAKELPIEFKGLLARTWANERINRLTAIIQAGVSAIVQAEYVAEIHRIGRTYQLWSPYNPFIE